MPITVHKEMERKKEEMKKEQCVCIQRGFKGIQEVYQQDIRQLNRNIVTYTRTFTI